MITSHPNTTIAIKGHPKELNCTARGERPIIIRWEKGDTVIDPDRVMRYAITTKDNGDEVVSTLKVSAHAPVSGDPDSRKAGIPQLLHLYPMEIHGHSWSPSLHPKMYLPFPSYCHLHPGTSALEPHCIPSLTTPSRGTGGALSPSLHGPANIHPRNCGGRGALDSTPEGLPPRGRSPLQ